jgi:hypothetical protein
MFRIASFLMSVLLASRTIATADPGTFEVDLLFPRNDTWAPTGTVPIVFGV